jgi:hypothetical protein
MRRVGRRSPALFRENGKHILRRNVHELIGRVTRAFTDIHHIDKRRRNNDVHDLGGGETNLIDSRSQSSGLSKDQIIATSLIDPDDPRTLQRRFHLMLSRGMRQSLAPTRRGNLGGTQRARHHVMRGRLPRGRSHSRQSVLGAPSGVRIDWQFNPSATRFRGAMHWRQPSAPESEGRDRSSEVVRRRRSREATEAVAIATRTGPLPSSGVARKRARPSYVLGNKDELVRRSPPSRHGSCRRTSPGTLSAQGRESFSRLAEIARALDGRKGQQSLESIERSSQVQV